MKIQRLFAAMAVAGLASVAVGNAHATLLVRSAFQDAALSVDGFGGDSGTISAVAGANSTVLKAYVYASSVWNFSPISDFTFNGTTFTPAQGTLLTPDANPTSTNIYDVTSIVKPIIDTGAGGQYDFTISDVNNDGEVLVVVYQNASTVGGTAIVMDGELASAGDTTTLAFTSPYTSGDAIMSLADSFSAQPSSQVSIIDVTTSSTASRRLTSCAGGQDDGALADGALMTAGGVGDSTSNPDPACSGSTGPTANDDELYNLALGNVADSTPFLKSGDTSLTLKTSNPSFDDNVFGLFFTTTFQVSDVNGNPVTPPTVPEPASLALLGIGLAGLGAMRRRKA